MQTKANLQDHLKSNEAEKKKLKEMSHVGVFVMSTNMSSSLPMGCA